MSILSWLKQRLNLDEADFQEEIRSHLEIAARERMAGGSDEKSARLESKKDFGNLLHTTEAARSVWRPRWLDLLTDLIDDANYSVRVLSKNPGFVFTVLAVLTIGIGLNAAVFTMLKCIAISPLAGVKQSASMGVIYAETSAGRQIRLSYPDYKYIRDHDQAFSGLMGTANTRANLGRGRGARQVFTELVSGNYFQVLGVRAQRGRTLLPSDEIAPGKHPIVVISDALWQRDFGSDPDIVGKEIEVNNQKLTIVGVTDPSFHGTIVSYDVELFIPIMTAPQLGYNFGSQATTPSGVLADRTATIFFPQGFLKPGTSLATAAAQTEALWGELSRDRALGEVAQKVKLVRFWQLPGSAPTYVMPTVIVLAVMGLLVLAIACANIAGLVLVRGVSRRGEVAVRMALGASRVRIVRLLVLENLILAVPGSILGVIFADRAIPFLVGFAERLAAPERIFFNLEFDAWAVGFAILVACGSALVFGFVPALQTSRVKLASMINEDASPRSAARGRLRSGLVVAQVAVSLLLLVGAGLVSRSFNAARQANPGFDFRQATAVSLDLKLNAYSEASGRIFYRKLLQAARAETESATLGLYNPLALLDTRAFRASIDGFPLRKGEDLAFQSNVVGPDYFRTLRIGFVAGREFDDRDDEKSAPVAIVNRTLAQKFWGSATGAIGKRIQIGDSQWRTIVGVASDVKYFRINEQPRPYVYLPLFQSYRSTMILYTRGSGPEDRLVEQARGFVNGLDKDLPILNGKPLEQTLQGAFLFYKLASSMLFVFGMAGMTLAALGTYGLVAYSVKQSTHEIGIRMALGASGRAVIRAFLMRGLKLGALGAIVGLVGALAVTRLLSKVLFGVSATDAVSFAQAIALVLVGVALATVIPACRASRTNPLEALRHF